MLNLYVVSVYPSGEVQSLNNRLFPTRDAAEEFYRQELVRLKDLQEHWYIEMWRSAHHPEGPGVVRHAEYNAREGVTVGAPSEE